MQVFSTTKPLFYLAALTFIIFFNSCTEEETPLEVVDFFNYNSEEEEIEIYPLMEAKYVIKATTEAPTISKIYLDGDELKLQSFNRNQSLGETTFTIIIPGDIAPDKLYDLEVITESGLVFKKSLKSIDFPEVVSVEMPDVMTPKRKIKFIIKNKPGWNHYKLEGKYVFNGQNISYSKKGKINGDTLQFESFAMGDYYDIQLRLYESSVEEENLIDNFNIMVHHNEITFESIPSYEFLFEDFTPRENIINGVDSLLIAHYVGIYSFLYKLELYQNDKLYMEFIPKAFMSYNYSIQRDYPVYYFKGEIPPGEYQVKVFGSGFNGASTFYAIPEITDVLIIQ